MRWRDVLKGVVIGIFIATASLSLGQCTQEAPATEITEVAVSDWKQCNTKVTIANNTEDLYYYTLYWVDHDVPDFNKPLPRAGGEIQPLSIQETSKTFRLCPGRHIMVWYKRGSTETNVMKFMIEADMVAVVILPTDVQPKINYFYKEPKQEEV